jgi:hypothetical protein
MAGLLSLSLIYAPTYWEAAVLIVFAVATSYGIRQLRYSEFEAARNVLGDDVVRREIGTRIAMQELERGLLEAETASECWNVIQGASQSFGLQAIRMQLHSELFTLPQMGILQDEWAMRISISEGNWIELLQGAALGVYPTGLVRFAETVRRVLIDKSVRMPFMPVSEPEYQPLVYGAFLSDRHFGKTSRGFSVPGRPRPLQDLEPDNTEPDSMRIDLWTTVHKRPSTIWTEGTRSMQSTEDNRR